MLNIQPQPPTPFGTVLHASESDLGFGGLPPTVIRVTQDTHPPPVAKYTILSQREANYLAMSEPPCTPSASISSSQL